MNDQTKGPGTIIKVTEYDSVGEGEEWVPSDTGGVIYGKSGDARATYVTAEVVENDGR